MKKENAVVTLLLVLILSSVNVSAQEKVNSDNGFAVLELFTSQGCSSCPPADEVLGNYVSENNQNVIALAFHVDYWNYIGWKDPYSSEKFTERQKLYDKNLRASVYTPQLVINGKEGIVGSEKSSIAKLVERELKLKSTSKIEIVATKLHDNLITIKYNCTTTGKEPILNVALVKTKEITNVKRGENSGRKLTGYNIVTDFNSESLSNKKAGEITLAFDKDKIAAEYSIIAYIQEKQQGKILAATKSKIQ